MVQSSIAILIYNANALCTWYRFRDTVKRASSSNLSGNFANRSRLSLDDGAAAVLAAVTSAMTSLHSIDIPFGGPGSWGGPGSFGTQASVPPNQASYQSTSQRYFLASSSTSTLRIPPSPASTMASWTSMLGRHHQLQQQQQCRDGRRKSRSLAGSSGGGSSGSRTPPHQQSGQVSEGADLRSASQQQQQPYPNAGPGSGQGAGPGSGQSADGGDGADQRRGGRIVQPLPTHLIHSGQDVLQMLTTELR